MGVIVKVIYTVFPIKIVFVAYKFISNILTKYVRNLSHVTFAIPSKHIAQYVIFKMA